MPGAAAAACFEAETEARCPGGAVGPLRGVRFCPCGRMEGKREKGMGWVGKFKWSFRDPNGAEEKRGGRRVKGVGQATPGPYILGASLFLFPRVFISC